MKCLLKQTKDAPQVRRKYATSTPFQRPSICMRPAAPPRLLARSVSEASSQPVQVIAILTASIPHISPPQRTVATDHQSTAQIMTAGVRGPNCRCSKGQEKLQSRKFVPSPSPSRLDKCRKWKWRLEKWRCASSAPEAETVRIFFVYRCLEFHILA